MYMDNYGQYGRGQGRDSALDNQILSDIDQREDMRNDAADLEGETAHLEQDASENQDMINELENSNQSMNESPEFGDDTEELEEPEEETPEFEDDAEEPEEEPTFEDDKA